MLCPRSASFPSYARTNPLRPDPRLIGRLGGVHVMLLVAMVMEGYEAVTAARQVIGATNPLEAAPGSIRGDFGLEVQTNLVHGSDSPESASREVGLFFPELGG